MLPQKDGEKPYGSFTIPDQKMLCWKYKEKEEANNIDVFTLLAERKPTVYISQD